MISKQSQTVTESHRERQRERGEWMGVGFWGRFSGLDRSGSASIKANISRTKRHKNTTFTPFKDTCASDP